MRHGGRRQLGLAAVTLLVLAAMLMPGAAFGQQGSSTPAPVTGYYYVVARGETWAIIARKMGVSVAELQANNPQVVRPNDVLWVGDRLYVPNAPGVAATPASAPTVAPATPEGSAGGYWYDVKSGDTWAKVARATGVSMAALWQANPRLLDANRWLYRGQRVWIPAVTTQPTATATEPAAPAATATEAPATVEVAAPAQAATATPTATTEAASLAEAPDLAEAAQAAATVAAAAQSAATVAAAAESAATVVAAANMVATVAAQAQSAVATITAAQAALLAQVAAQAPTPVPTATPIPPTATPVPTTRAQATATRAAATKVEATAATAATSVAATRVKPTATRVPPTATPLPAQADGACLLDRVLAANKAFDMWSQEGFQPAIVAYQTVLTDTTATACGAVENELALLRDFARYRMLLAYIGVGQGNQATAVRSQMETPAMRGAADAFLTSLKESGSIVQACRDTTKFAKANPTAWEWLVELGVEFEPADLCPLG